MRSAAPSRISATAPFSATMAATGQVRAKGSLQPSGRPVMAITGTPRRAQRMQRLERRGVEPAVGGERVVDIGHDADHAPQRLRRQAGQRLGPQGAHAAPPRPVPFDRHQAAGGRTSRSLTSISPQMHTHGQG